MLGDTSIFNFDVQPFIDGVNRLGAGMDRIQSRAQNMGKTISSSVGKAVNGAIMKVGLLIGAFKAAGAVLKQMPEVGQAFGIAKDIFLKNLLWPLRQQVMPMLQRMLDWVRDNRARFVQWGVTVANVFRTVVVVAKTLWEIFRGLVDTVANAFQKAFNTSFRSFDEFLNVFSFKVSAVIIYMGMLAKQLTTDLTPFFDWVVRVGSQVLGFWIDLAKAWGSSNKQGESLWTLLDKMKTTIGLIGNFIENMVKGFREGFVPAVQGMMTPLNTIATAFNNLLKVLGFGDSDGIRGAFSALGTILGTTLVASLSTVATLFDGLVTALGTLASMVGIIEKVFAGDWAGVKDEFGKIGDTWKDWGSRTKMNFQAVMPGTKVNDAIITKSGQVIQTHPDDNIIATKTMPALSAAGAGGMALGPMSIGPFYVTVTEGDAREAGRAFGSGLGETFRTKVSTARLREGR